MKTKHIHFVGIKGVGMTPLAIIAKEAGIKVTGSDIRDEFITDVSLRKAGIKVFQGFSAKNVGDPNLVITTGAHGGLGNEEVKCAREKNIKILTQGEAVGVFMDGEIFGKKFSGVSVAGSHGKTTTTAMTATIFKESGLDPSYLIGTGDVSSLGMPGHYGKGKYFIAEADEYATEPNLMDDSVFGAWASIPKFMWHNPKIAIFTNIDLDHPDLYDSNDEMREAFLKFAGKLSADSILIANGDDEQIRKLLLDYRGRVITFGFSPKNDYVLTNVRVSLEHTFFWAETHGVSLGEFLVGVCGEHNVLNAAASIVAALEAGIKLEIVKKGIAKFSGTKRRFEFIGKLSSGAMLFDDYAHHPTEIKSTLKAFRQSFPKSKIVCIFQPHTYSRTKKLFEDFKYSFSDCNLLILTNIYSSLREKPDPSVSSELLVREMSRFSKNVLFLPELSNVVEYIKQKHYKSDTVIITMGAGDVYKIASSL